MSSLVGGPPGALGP